MHYETPGAGRIEPIFNGVFGAAREQLCDLAPAVAVSVLGLQHGAVFGERPRARVDGGVELVEPSLAALLPEPTKSQSLGHLILTER
jgi:hypothetical protein